MKPWKSTPKCFSMFLIQGLQWGHGDEAVEETGTATHTPPGPRQLQWGHGDEAVEEFVTIFGPTLYYELQWGHVDEDVEEGTTRALLRCRLWCFNGATAMKPWKRPSVRRSQETITWLQWGHGDEAVEEVDLPRSSGG